MMDNAMTSTLDHKKKLANSMKVAMKNRLESMLEECYRLAVQVCSASNFPPGVLRPFFLSGTVKQKQEYPSFQSRELSY